MKAGQLMVELYRVRPVLCNVSLIHLAGLMLIIGLGLAQSCQTQPEQVTEVQIIDLPGDWPPTGASAPLEPLPPPDPPPPIPQPESEPPQTMPEPEPSQQTAPAPAAPETPAPPSWQARTPDQIRGDALRKVTSRPPAPASPPPTSTPSESASDIAARARTRISRQNLTVAIPETSNRAAVSTSNLRRYADAVYAVFNQKWQPPSASSVPARHRQTTVSLIISGNGNIRNAQLSRPSGNASMDQSVMSIFDRLQQLPPPRDYNILSDPFEINVTLVLD